MELSLGKQDQYQTRATEMCALPKLFVLPFQKASQNLATMRSDRLSLQKAKLPKSEFDPSSDCNSPSAVASRSAVSSPEFGSREAGI
jgi:hypothetical protein